MDKKIIIIGSGGHARSCLDVILSEKKYKFLGYIDKNPGKTNIIGSDKDFKKIFKKAKYALIGIGQIKNYTPRLKIFKKLKKIGFKLPIVKSKNSYVSKLSSIGEGTVIMHGAIVNAFAKIGKNTIINTGAIIEHDVVVGDNCHISTNVTINGECKIGNNTFVGSNSVVVNNIEIGKYKFIKCNSLIKKDLI